MQRTAGQADIAPGLTPHTTFQLHSSAVGASTDKEEVAAADGSTEGRIHPMKISSACSCVSVCPRNLAMGPTSGSRGRSALCPRQLCFCRLHSEKASNSGDSCDTMQRYEHTWLGFKIRKWCGLGSGKRKGEGVQAHAKRQR